MRVAWTALLAASMAGCAATREEVVAKLGDQHVGKNVDALVARLGPPASSCGYTSYLWQLSAETDIDLSSNGHGSSGSATTNFCKVGVIASAAGMPKALTTEDASRTQGILGLAGVDIYGSVCARHLGIWRES